MDIDQFRTELEAALVQELLKHEREFSPYSMQSFDLGIHPWHGYIEPSFFTTQDTCGPKEIGDWKLYSFADTKGEKWPQAGHIAKWMQSFYASDPQRNAAQLFKAATEVVTSRSVREALGRYRTTPTFFVSVFNPDDPSFENHCA